MLVDAIPAVQGESTDATRDAGAQGWGGQPSHGNMYPIIAAMWGWNACGHIRSRSSDTQSAHDERGDSTLRLSGKAAYHWRHNITQVEGVLSMVETRHFYDC